MYRLYIDETGNADLNASDDPNHRYLSLTGVIIHQDHIRNVVTPQLNALKQEVFNPDPDEPIILHRKDIMQRNRPFHVLRDPFLAQLFDGQLLTLLQSCEYTVITVVIDKLEHRSKYNVWRYEPYHYCMEALLERYALWLNLRGRFGDVMAEVRSRYFDRRLEKSFARHYKRGTSFVRADVMQNRLTSKHLKMRRKETNITGLQVADVLAHPSMIYVRSLYGHANEPIRFGAEISEILRAQKYNRTTSGKIVGYGIKWLP